MRRVTYLRLDEGDRIELHKLLLQQTLRGLREREEPSKDNPESNLLDDNRPVVEIELVAGLALEKDIAEADLRR